VLDDLEEHRRQHADRVQRHVVEQGGRVRGGEEPVPHEQVEVQQRVGGAAFDGHEGEQEQRGGHQQHDAARAHPPPLWGEGERHQQADEEGAPQRGADDVGPRLMRTSGGPADRPGVSSLRLKTIEALVMRQEPPSPGQDHESDGHHEEEDSLPAERVRQEPAERRPDAQAKVDRGDVDAERAPTLLRREGVGDDRDRGGSQPGRPYALEAAAGDEPSAVRAEGTEQGAGREDGDPDEVVAHPAALVSEPAQRDQQDRHRQQVDGLDPHRGAEAQAEVLAHRGQGDRRDGPQKRVHEGADAGEGEHLPASAPEVVERGGSDRCHGSESTASHPGTASREAGVSRARTWGAPRSTRRRRAARRGARGHAAAPLPPAGHRSP